jgi:hypothetical protein
MKNLLLILFIVLSHTVMSQTIGTFTKAKDYIQSGDNEEVEYFLSIKIPQAKQFKNYKLGILLVADKTTIPLDNIYLPANTNIVINEKTEDGIKIKFKRDAKDDKIITFKLTAVDNNNKPIDLKSTDTLTTILIKSLNTDALNKNDNFWLYTGTNIDFLDGVKPKELNFKAAYLFNIKNNDKITKHWLYITGGKNRYSSANDSLGRVTYSDLDISKFNNDSVYIKTGFYKSAYEQVTDNIYTSFDYLYELNNSQQSKAFFTSGLYIGYQSIKTTYKNTVLSTRSLSFPITSSPTLLLPLARNNTKHQLNYNVSVGFLYKVTNDTYDIKAHINAGYNRFFYPYYRKETIQGINEGLVGQNNMFVQIRLEGTVLNPGLSLGIETFLRSGAVPLFNVSFTKVLTLKQIGSLFGKTSTGLNN